MAPFNLLTWDFDFFLLSGRNDSTTKRTRKGRVILASIYLTVAVLARFWLAQVMKHVPRPYLDEVFHIPQAQAYCRGELDVWDPKLTTPPGLYIVSALLIKSLQWGSCTVQELRTVNFLSLILLLFVAQGCRGRIINRELRNKEFTRKKDMKIKTSTERDIDWDAVHTAVNICLFPPLFFFSGLYYTDVLSTCTVVGAYHYFLKHGETRGGKFRDDRAGQNLLPRSISQGWKLYLIGLATLFMRQTNIFWVAIFMAGLETVRSFRSEFTLIGNMDKEKSMLYAGDFVKACSDGAIHDPILAEAEGLDIFWCALSLMLAVLIHLRVLLFRLWPYLALLSTFGLFVAWNGGVVLGDKSNHVATLHLSQMLYIWPFMAFFSLPLLYQTLLDVLYYFSPVSFRRLAFSHRPKRILEWSTVAWLIGSLTISVIFVHFNTIIHPFTLADNRHYVFYVFRYTIRRHPLMRYALTPIYVLCGWLIFRCLAGTRDSQVIETVATEKDLGTKPQTGELTLLPHPNTSFTLVWFLSTALSLVSAPLVEPRYFIIPWVMWRLHLPSAALNTIEAKKPTKSSTKGQARQSNTGWSEWTKFWIYKGHDPRLWFETFWYLLLSMATGFIFLVKGFEWPQEPGEIQRFLW